MRRPEIFKRWRYACGHLDQVMAHMAQGTIVWSEAGQVCASCECAAARLYVEDTTALQASHAYAARMADANPGAYYGAGPGPDTEGGCSCQPSNGADCHSCS